MFEYITLISPVSILYIKTDFYFDFIISKHDTHQRPFVRFNHYMTKEKTIHLIDRDSYYGKLDFFYFTQIFRVIYFNY